MECAGLWSRRSQGQNIAKGSNSQSCFVVLFLFLMETWGGTAHKSKGVSVALRLLKPHLYVVTSAV